MEEEQGRARRPLELDWDKLLPSASAADDLPPALVIVNSTASAGAANNSPTMAACEAVDQFSDHQLLDRIRSTKRTVSLARTLPDKGAKLVSTLQRLEDEWKKRERRRAEPSQPKESAGIEKPTPPIISSDKGGPKYSKGENETSQDPKEPSFAASFLQKMDVNQTACRKPNAFDEEVSLLGPCNQQKKKSYEHFSKKQKHGNHSPSRFYSVNRQNPSREGDKQVGRRNVANFSNRSQKGRDSSISSQDTIENCGNIRAIRKCRLPLSNHKKTIILEDEEECQLMETSQQVEKPDESMKDMTIYYPSRCDPEAVEISYSDFDCLAPQAYLRSNIMNFYIRYLQQHVSPTNRVMRNCHFFNTFFYDKLKEVLSHKGNSRDEFFLKFRRWWKGVNNIFLKEYILIPINEFSHWSLVIVCIPDKEEQSGPIVLHLDSLGLHSRKSVFQNIKSFLVAEWNHLRPDVCCSDLPIAESIWESLPRRIVDNSIVVPQQKNDYDCGLFVLYFMKRFVEDASGRLKCKDLSMFGKKWFKPEEASGLRAKINKLLIEEFKNAQKTNNTGLEPSSLSSPALPSDVEEFKNAPQTDYVELEPSSPPSPPLLFVVEEV